MMTFEQFLESRVYVPRGKGQVTPQVQMAMMRLINQGIKSPKEIHAKVQGEGFKVTYAALYPYIRKELDKVRQLAWDDLERQRAMRELRSQDRMQDLQSRHYLKKQEDEDDNFYTYDPDEDDDESLPSPFFGNDAGGGKRINRSTKIYS